MYLQNVLPIRRSVTFLALLGACGSLSAQLSSDDLVKASPFVPHNWTAGGAAQQKPVPAGQQYEFRGAYSLAGVHYVNVIDRTSGKGYWLEVGSESNGIRPTRYDTGTRTLVATINGQSMELVMPQQGTHGGAVATAVNSYPGRPGMTGQNPAQTASGATNPTNVRRVNRVPPPPPPMAAAASRSGGNVAGVPRPPGNLRQQSQSTPNGVSNNSGVYTPSTGNNSNPTNRPSPPSIPTGGPPTAAPGFTPTIPPEIQDMIKNRRPPPPPPGGLPD